jgi:hypothetical protein
MAHKVLLETTEWDMDFQPNHTYIVEGGRSGRALGYVKKGTEAVIWFSKPMPFDRKHRTFKELKGAKYAELVQ